MGRAENSSVGHGIEVRRNLRPAGQSNGPIDVVPALVKSRVDFLYGRPYPVQFRNQGAFDAWKQLLGHTDVWPIWAHPQTICWDIRQDILRQLHQMPLFSTMTEAEDGTRQGNHMLGIGTSANLMYLLRMGTVIETTPALETLLANSEIDLDLPMNMVAPPYSAQYLHFGETAARHLKAPDAEVPDQCFDGVFCFYTPPSE